MSEVVVKPGKTFGGVGYPMVATTLAGMELLGQLLMPNTDPFDQSKGNEYFLNYWNNYFSQKYPEYTGLGRLFRQLMRNGISHTFVAKPGIFVEKGTNRQMSVDTTRQEIYIDCNVFYMEFEDSYSLLVKPIIDVSATSPATTKATMQTRLDNLSTSYTGDSTRLFSGLPTLHSSTNNTGRRAQVPVSPLFSHLGVMASGASLSLGPTNHGPSGPMGTTTPTTTSTSTSTSMSAATATIPPASITMPFPTVSGTLPPKTKP